MQKLVVFTEEEFRGKLAEFATNLKADWLKGWGYKVVSRETGKDIMEEDGIANIAGSVLMAWDKTFNKV